jgi:hypothetical protein
MVAAQLSSGEDLMAYSITMVESTYERQRSYGKIANKREKRGSNDLLPGPAS